MKQEAVWLCAALCIMLLLGGGIPCAAAARPPPSGPQRTRFDSTYDAVMSLNNTKAFKDILVSFLAPGLSKDLISRYQYILPVVQNGGSTLTAFVPTNEAMQEAREYMCMSAPEMEKYTADNPETVLENVEMQLANTTTAVYSSEFKDGLELATYRRGFNLVIKQKVGSDGSVQWVLPGMSQNGSDITIVRTDIPAGKGVVHLIDGLVVGQARKELNLKMRQQRCGSSLTGDGSKAPGSAVGPVKSSAASLREPGLWSSGGRGSGLLLALGAAVAAAVI